MIVKTGERLGIAKEGRTWTLRYEVITVKPVREESTPEEIIEYLKGHAVEIGHVPSKGAPADLRRIVDEWARRKLGLTP
ncbi:TPA: hypothetical protein EYP44_00655 [Candidatus Bathyarchaeota archaeon]|nr:hypothetical protein [Candidatus Bathyarchaeota archaeon]